MNDEGIVAVITLGILLLAAVVIGLPARQITHHLDVSNCHTFSAQTGYPTKWVDYNFFKWDCMGKTKDGRWLPTDKLRDVN